MTRIYHTTHLRRADARTLTLRLQHLLGGPKPGIKRVTLPGRGEEGVPGTAALKVTSTRRGGGDRYLDGLWRQPREAAPRSRRAARGGDREATGTAAAATPSWSRRRGARARGKRKIFLTFTGLLAGANPGGSGQLRGDPPRSTPRAQLSGPPPRPARSARPPPQVAATHLARSGNHFSEGGRIKEG